LSFTPSSEIPDALDGFLSLVRQTDGILSQLNTNYTRTLPIEKPVLTTTEGGDAMDLSLLWTAADSVNGRRPKNAMEREARLPCSISHENGPTFSTSSFIDSGCSAKAFYDTTKAHQRNLIINPLQHPKTLRLADGTPASAGKITHTTAITMNINGHTELLTCFLTDLGGKHELLLGKPWLNTHDPEIKWSIDTVNFTSQFCRENCVPQHLFPVLANGSEPPPPIPKPQATISTRYYNGRPRRVGAESFITLAQRNEVQIFTISIKDIDNRLAELAPKSTVVQESHVEIAKFSAEDIRKALEPKEYIDPAVRLPQHYHQHIKAFDVKSAEILPPHRPCDHQVNLKPGTVPPSGPLYNMSVDELRVLRKWLDENLKKGFIRPSTSPAASPVLFAKKPGGGLRFCVDYRGLNAITIKNRYPLPLLHETLSRLGTAKYFTKLDVIGAFNQIRMAEGHEYLTAFNTRYGLFESLVMPFGLTNAPATFQARINEVLRPYLDITCTAYIDDILIYSDTLEEHKKHVNEILNVLTKAGLKLDIKKCEFDTQKVIYLGLIISTSGIQMDPQKIECIINWENCKNAKDV
ncbi:hypothetical protein K3495_g14941, partial [Podosphaera aphanis]